MNAMLIPHARSSRLRATRHPLAVALSLALAATAPAVGAATIQVTTADDAGTTSTCTLRQAIASMNAAAIGSSSSCVNSGGSFGSSDTITFASDVTTVTLADAANNELLITGSNLTITGTGTGGVMVSRLSGATNAFRIFHDTYAGFGAALYLNGLKITNGATTAANASGGAILMNSTAYGAVTLTKCIVSGNSTAGLNAVGGAIAVGSVGSNHGAVNLTNSTISGNSTGGAGAGGGAIYATGGAYLQNSVVSGNSTVQNSSPGGAIQTNHVRMLYNTISHNSTQGDNSPGGGIAANGLLESFGNIVSYNSTAGLQSPGGGISTYYTTNLYNDIVLNNSTIGNNSNGGGIYITGKEGLQATATTISGNRATGNSSGGGGVWARFGRSISGQLRNSTVSGNSASVGGGGITVNVCSSTAATAMKIYSSTFAFNTSGAGGGGLYVGNNGCASGINPTSATISATSSILSNNLAGSANSSDIGVQTGFALTVDTSFDLIKNVPSGAGITITNSGTSPAIISVDPLLKALADNGCGTPSGAAGTTACVPTVAIGCNSPAYNTGSNSAQGFQYDERGKGFPRVGGAQADIGAYEDDDEIFCTGFEVSGSVQ